MVDKQGLSEEEKQALIRAQKRGEAASEERAKIKLGSKQGPDNSEAAAAEARVLEAAAKAKEAEIKASQQKPGKYDHIDVDKKRAEAAKVKPIINENLQAMLDEQKLAERRAAVAKSFASGSKVSKSQAPTSATQKSNEKLLDKTAQNNQSVDSQKDAPRLKR